METKKVISDTSKIKIQKIAKKSGTGKALQVNDNSANATQLYENKTEKIIQKDEVAGLIEPTK